MVVPVLDARVEYGTENVVTAHRVVEAVDEFPDHGFVYTNVQARGFWMRLIAHCIDHCGTLYKMYIRYLL